jgi:hypothetical protein
MATTALVCNADRSSRLYCETIGSDVDLEGVVYTVLNDYQYLTTNRYSALEGFRIKCISFGLY